MEAYVVLIIFFDFIVNERVSFPPTTLNFLSALLKVGLLENGVLGLAARHSAVLLPLLIRTAQSQNARIPFARARASASSCVGFHWLTM